MARAGRVGVATASAVALAYVGQRLPTAFHEAGHAIIGVHLGECGITCDDGSHGDIDARPPGPLLRFATVTSRTTAKGQVYLGETKLTVRWRDMPRYVRWHHVDPSASSSSSPVLQKGTVVLPDSSSGSHGAEQDGAGPSATLALARVTYLLGGWIAQDRLAPSLALPFVSSPQLSEDERVDTQLDRLIARPGTASGDLRKARALVCNGSADAATGPSLPSPSLPALRAAFAFADAIVSQRWADLCALSGALLVRGTVDGSQMASLVQQRRRALNILPRQQQQQQPDSVEAEPPPPLLRLVSPFPFLFGCIWAATLWPARDPRLAGPGEPARTGGGGGE
jgi:hypothetical protein